MKTIDLREVTPEVREDLRKRAIRLLKKGKMQIEVSELLNVHKNTINNWYKRYRLSGAQGLKEKARGHKMGEGRLLTKDEEKKVQKWITDTMPDQLKLPYGLWTRKAIRELIKNELKITIAIRTIGTYLKRWGFSPQKPKKKAYEQNSKLVQTWLEKEYPKIKSKAKKEGATIHWGDETGVRNDNNHGRSYAPKGKTPTKEKMAKRLSLNMISTVTNQGLVRFMLYKGTMNAKRLLIFFKRLIKGSASKIYLILDNLRVHHAKIVRQWVDENQSSIELHFLPSYAPELNPDEYLNCDLKGALSYKPAPKDDDELKRIVNSHMRLLQNRPDRVAKYFHHKSIKYAA